MLLNLILLLSNAVIFRRDKSTLYFIAKVSLSSTLDVLYNLITLYINFILLNLAIILSSLSIVIKSKSIDNQQTKFIVIKSKSIDNEQTKIVNAFLPNFKKNQLNCNKDNIVIFDIFILAIFDFLILAISCLALIIIAFMLNPAQLINMSSIFTKILFIY